MYKWHVNSAIGRGRPRAGDFAKVADGIAASLRHFHVSLSRTAEDGGGNNSSQPSRAQRSAAAAAEISTLSLGGIDARSFAAAPPTSFTIRRIDQLGPSEKRSVPGSRSGVFRDSGSRGRGGSGASRGRGGMRGRGGRGGRGGRNRGMRKRGGGRSNADMAGGSGPPLTPEEQAYVDSVEMGVPTPAHVGITDLETLKKEVPGLATLTAPIGLVNTIRDHMRVLAGEHGNEYLSSEQHAKHYLHGEGTLFVDDEDRARAQGSDRFEGSPEVYDTLDETGRESVLQTLVGGQYQPIKPIAKGDTLTTVDAYSQKNETYLTKDAVMLRARVQKMLPSQTAATLAKQAALH